MVAQVEVTSGAVQIFKEGISDGPFVTAFALCEPCVVVRAERGTVTVTAVGDLEPVR